MIKTYSSILLVYALGALGITDAIAQDAAAGKAVYQQCAVCHSIDGTNGIGPSLKGVVGHKSGEIAGFRSSRAMKSAAITWDAKTLDAYLAEPQKVVPGNQMPFSGMTDAKQRADVIAYMSTLK